MVLQQCDLAETLAAHALQRVEIAPLLRGRLVACALALRALRVRTPPRPGQALTPLNPGYWGCAASTRLRGVSTAFLALRLCLNGMPVFSKFTFKALCISPDCGAEPVSRLSR